MIECPICRKLSPDSTEKCECGRLLSASTHPTQPGPQGGFIAAFFWIVTLVAALPASYVLAEALTADSAPKQGAGAAIAAAIAIIPYCFARAISELTVRRR